MTNEMLVETIKWALANGAMRHTYGGSITYQDGGCGCCSGDLDIPPEIKSILKEVYKDG